jgi:hypothetical protein
VIVAASSEEKILTACCRFIVGAIGQEQLKNNFRQTVDDEKLLALAEKQCLVLLLNYCVKISEAENLSKKLKQRTQAINFSQLQLMQITKRLQELFLQQSIPVIFLKGAVLAQQLFGKQLLRYSGDIDLLVVAKDVLAVDGCLQKLGYRTCESKKQMQRLANKKSAGQKDALYYKAGSNIRIELHWKTSYLEQLSYSEQLSEVNFQGVGVSIFSNKLNVLYLCWHASMHGWSRLRWLLDIVLFLQKEKIDLKELLNFAAQRNLQAVILEFAFMASETLGLREFKNVADGLSVKRQRQLQQRHEIMSLEKQTLKQRLQQIYLKAIMFSGFKNQFSVARHLLANAVLNKFRKVKR